MNDTVEHDTRVECRDCLFSTIVQSGADERPADVVIEHGRETGHKLQSEPLEQPRNSSTSRVGVESD